MDIYPLNIESTIVIFAMVAALGIVMMVAVEIILTAQEAEAAKSPTGECASTFMSCNASLICRPRQ